MTPVRMVPSGTTLAGRYTLERELGAGAMGTVFKAHDTRLGRDVAVKLLVAERATDADAIRRFEREARAASALNHPNIITVFDAGVDGETPFIVTELLHGTTLHDRIDGRPVAPALATDFAMRIASGLAAAHAAGIVHRDVKPQNIFLTRDGGLKLLDFGVARLSRRDGPADAAVTAARAPVGASAGASATVTHDGAMVGTPAYMAPEQLRGEPVDARTDIFAFGCVLQEMLTGQAPFMRDSIADVLAAILMDPPDPLPTGVAVPPILERIRLRCLEKDPTARFQSAADLRFALETLRETKPEVDTRIGDGRRFALRAWMAIPPVVLAVAAWVLARATAPQPDMGPVVEQATVVVPAAAQPIAPAIAPDGRWVTYIGLAGAAARLYVQFLAGGPAVELAREENVPLQTRTIVGGLDVTPDGSGIAIAGRPRAAGLFTIPGIWIVPAPLGGPPRRLTEGVATVRWSPDGTRIASVVANPVLGDIIAVSAADGQNRREVVPASGGLHLHHVAWGHDGRHVYYVSTLEPNHALTEIWRVAVDGGAPERVVATQGMAVFPTPTPDGRGLIYAGDRSGEGLNLWWHPFDGSPERRLTTGVGEFTEPFLSRDGRHLVALARRRRGGVMRVELRAAGAAAPVQVTDEASDDGDPSVDRMTGRVFLTSLRGGRRQIWSVGPTGRDPRPVTSGSDTDRRPKVSLDGQRVAFVSSREGRRGIWVVAAAGGTPRRVIEAEIVDYPSWAPDGRRLVYATAGRVGADLWTLDVDGGAPVRLPVENGRAPAWSPVAEEIAYVGLTDGTAVVRFVDPTGRTTREPISIDGVSQPTAIEWSPDGTRLALVNLPGRAAAEAWVIDVRTRQRQRVVQLPAPAEIEGVSWSADGRALLLGRAEFDTEVILLRLR